MAPRDFKGEKDMARFASFKALKVGSTMVGQKRLHGSRFGDLRQVLNHDASNLSDSRAFPCGLDSDKNDSSHDGSVARNNGDLDDKATVEIEKSEGVAASLEPNMEALNPTNIMVFSIGMDEDVRPLEAPRVSHEGMVARVSHENVEARVEGLNASEVARVSPSQSNLLTSPNSSSFKSYADIAAKENETSVGKSISGSWASIVAGNSTLSMKLSYIQPPPPSLDEKITIKPPSSVVQKGIAR